MWTCKPATGASTSPGRDVTDDDAIRCAACGHAITDRHARMDMNGAHEHTFVNPGGFVHRVGCYLSAPGCVHTGPTESAFSYFPGYTWQLAVCSRCRVHLGWIFRCAGQQFHGLLVENLRP